MVKLGLVIGSAAPRPVARPRVKVVLPAPTSPISSITIGYRCVEVKFLAKLEPKSNISCSVLIIIV